MTGYAPILVQVLLLGLSLYLFFSLRAKLQNVASGQQFSEITELQLALTDMIDELQETAKKANVELGESTAKASELVRTIDEKMMALKEAADKAPTRVSPLPKRLERVEERIRADRAGEEPKGLMAMPRRLSVPGGQGSSVDIARRSKTGRGEVELMLNLERWQEVKGS